MKTIELDGSYGEGGGQILRTALSLSCVTGHALKLFNIRGGRKKPGLMPQHITCVNAASEITGAKIKGAEAGSTELIFVPGKTMPGNYIFDIKTAGSCTLVFQTLLPPLMFGEGSSIITIRGGTHVPLSPTYHYLSEVLLTMLRNVGVHVDSTIYKYGFYPKGGGEVKFTVHPVSQVKGLDLSERGELIALHGYSAVSRLPVQIARRQKNAMEQKVKSFPADIQIMNVVSPGEGTFTFLAAQYENTFAGFSSIGKRGKPAEKVGAETASAFLDFNCKSTVFDPHLADQIVLYLSLSRQDSSFTTSCITEHLLTNLWVIKKFIDIHYQVEGQLNSEGRIKILHL
ncbi:MAG: RNA 3'-phosphate cyclase [Nitrospira bacterium SG8_35_1]|nr:MAG: RNA 3'-phosphate cyclase [Nitrospira bacterium SG8_35_1]